jgi:hypothetical protein
LTLASITATNPNPEERPVSERPAASIAPTMMTELIALVSDISGECSAGVTFQTT